MKLRIIIESKRELTSRELAIELSKLIPKKTSLPNFIKKVGKRQKSKDLEEAEEVMKIFQNSSIKNYPKKEIIDANVTVDI